MVVYLDLLWLINFGFDSLLLLWTTMLLQRKLRLWRIFSGGMFGSLTVFVYISEYDYLLNSLLFKLVISLVMVVIGICSVSLRQYIRALVTFYLITFLAGGLLYGIHSLFSDQTINFIASNNITSDKISLWFVSACFPLTYILLKNHSNSLKKVHFFKKQVVEAVCLIDNVKIEITGLIDTGNQLTDPLTNVPIVIVSIVKQETCLPEAVFMPSSDVVNEDLLPERWRKRMRLIPYKVVGSDRGLLLAFKPDQFTINNENKKCLVSFTRQRLSEVNNYNAIVHPDLAG